MYVRLCNHIKENGRSCRSPALRKHLYCYFHDEVQRRLARRLRRQERRQP